MLLQSSQIQWYIGEKTTEVLSEKIGSEVNIGKLTLGFREMFVINDFVVKDQQNDSLLSVSKLGVTINPFRLFRKQVSFSKIRLEDSYISVSRNQDGVTNFQYIIDSLFNNNNLNVKLRFNSIILSDINIKYRDFTPVSPNDKINFKQLDVQHLYSSISINNISKGNMDIALHELTFKEQSGFALKNMKGAFKNSPTLMELTDFQLALDKTSLNIDHIRLHHEEKISLKELNGLSFDIGIDSSRINLHEIEYFIPSLNNFKHEIVFSASVKGTPDNIKGRDIFVKYGNNMVLNGNLDLIGLPNLNETYLHAQINKLTINIPDARNLIGDITGKPLALNLPNSLGTIKYTGNISGFFNKMVAYGNFSNASGKISTDVLIETPDKWKSFSFSGALKSSKLDISHLLNNPLFGNISFNIEANGKKSPDNKFEGDINGNIHEFTFRNYPYKNIALAGRFDQSGFEGHVGFVDENLNFTFDGLIDISQKPNMYQFTANIENFHPHNLNLISKYEDLSFKFNVATNLVGNNIDSLEGSVKLKDIIISRQENDYPVNLFEILALNNPFLNERILVLKSDYVNGKLSGKYSLSHLVGDFNNLLSDYVPAVFKRKEITTIHENDFNFNIDVEKLSIFNEVFDIPLDLLNDTKLAGFYNQKENKFSLETTIPSISYNKFAFSDFNLTIRNPDEKIELYTSLQANNGYLVDLFSEIYNDSVSVNLALENESKKEYTGTFNAISSLVRNENTLAGLVHIFPSSFILKDSVWNIHESDISIQPNRISVKDFELQSNNQHLSINGIASPFMDDEIKISTSDFDLKALFSMLKLKNFSLGGIMSGNIYVQSALKKPIFRASIDVQDFELNDTPNGDLFLLTKWNESEKQIDIEAYTLKNGSFPAVIHGFVSPQKDSIDITIDAKDFDLSFIKRYLTAFASDFGAEISGKVQFVGSLKRPYLMADAYARNGKIGIDYLNTVYYFEDSIRSDQRGFIFKNVSIYDKYKNPGKLNGVIYHNFFKNIRYGLEVTCHNMLVNETTSKHNDVFYGTAFGTGNVRIYGSPGLTNIDVNVRAEDRTKMQVSLDTKSVAMENSFIVFKPDSGAINTENPNPVLPPSNSKLKLNLLLDVNTTSEITLILDQRWGDALTARGEGQIGIEYETGNDFNMYGSYTIEEGAYNFTLQNIIRKNFLISQGSNIKFQGSPSKAILDVNARYILTASLLDLLDGSEFSSGDGRNFRTNALVNCILNLTGPLEKPEISFGIELPNADEEIKQRVQSIISSEDMLNTQIIYLLALNRFYTPDYVNVQGNTSDQFGSFATSALSAQLNNILSEVTNAVNIGVNYRSGNYNSSQGPDETIYNTEVEVALSTQLLNNRLLINGNIGYRDGVVNGSNFIGDFDIEYKLNKSGKLRAKAYNHTNDMVYKSAQFTQGAGIMYREDFDTFKGLFEHYKSVFENLKNKRQSKKEAREREADKESDSNDE